MIECKEICNLLSDLIDDELELNLEKEIRRHIYKCEKCSSSLNTFTKTLDLIHSIKSQPIPLKVHKKLWKVIYIETRHLKVKYGQKRRSLGKHR